MIRTLAIPIILGWIAAHRRAERRCAPAGKVGQLRSVSMSPDSAPSMIAMKRVGEVFQEFDSNSSAMIVLEGQEPLGDDAHKFYDEMIDKLEADTQARRARPGLLERPAHRRRARRATTARPPTSRCTSRATRARRWPTSRSRPFRTSSTAAGADRASRPTSPGPAALAADQHIAGDRSMQLIEARHLHGDHRDAAARLPVDRHGAADPRHGRAPVGRRPRRRRVPRLTTRSSDSRRSPPTCW